MADGRTGADWYVYLLRCADGSLYTGVATDLPAIEGYSEGVYTLPASARMFEAVQLLADFAQKVRRELQAFEEGKNLSAGQNFCRRC